MFSDKERSELSVGFYFWVPLFLVLSPYALQWMFGEARWLHGELGIFELLTFVLLVMAVYFILRAELLAITLRILYLPVWLILMLLGSIYFAGEEISWGQHFFLWETSQAWQSLNDQQETNLHNIHAVFDQLPRALLTFAALIGGILVPLYRGIRGIEPPVNEMAGWLWPTGVCVPVCMGALTISLLDDLAEDLIKDSGDTLPAWLDISGGEMKECLLALFILFYAMSLFRRLKVSAVRFF